MAALDLIDDPVIVVDHRGDVVEANGAAREAVAGLIVGAALPIHRSRAAAFERLLRYCVTTAEAVPGTIPLPGPEGEIVRRQCRGRKLILDDPSGRDLVLLHFHSAPFDRRFGLLSARLLSARRVMDERRRREAVLKALLRDHEDLLARQEAEAAARREAERERDEVLSRLYHAGQDERLRLARDLHDHAGQQVVALNLGLARLARHLTGPEAAGEHEALLRQVQGIVDSLRRVVLELRPPALDEFGFVTALRALAQDWSECAGIPAEFKVVGRERPLAPDVAITLYRVAQEAMTNAAKHGGAVETVAVILRFDQNRVTLTVDDDGHGFLAHPAALRSLFNQGRLGLAGMRERLLLVGGKLRILSAPSRGTTIVARAYHAVGDRE